VTYSTIRQHKLFRPVAGSLLAMLAGLVLWATVLRQSLTNASYDYLYRFSTYSVTNQVVLILMDNNSYVALGQTRGQWDRSLHARLFNKLADDDCPLAVVDVKFLKHKDAAGDQALAAALGRMKNVVLAAGLELVAHNGMAGVQPAPPLDMFLSSSQVTWAVDKIDDEVIKRHHWPFPDPGPYLNIPQKAAAIMGVHLSTPPTEKWIRYYDFDRTWTRLSYDLALHQPPGYFHGKIVFVGNQPVSTALDPGDDDKFQVPQTQWTGQAVGGVEILVTSFLNLLNGDWLRRPASPLEGLVLVLTGGFLGFVLSLWRRLWTVLLAFGLAYILIYAGVLLSEVTNYWFPWLIVVGGQLPCALIVALIYPKPAVAKSPAKARATGATIALVFPEDDLPDAPDFEFYQPHIGQGSFGKVWIVRNAIGQYQALKAIYQSNFGQNKAPYEAEFKGLQKYKPVSEKHAGLLRIELISKMKEEGYFYYVMELGDAQKPGWETDPASYKPRDLENMRRQKHLPPGECLRILAILADALDFLHRQGLIHRDIKPSNVIFVNERPKLADIGLVADIRPAGHLNTMVGTPGYMPPMPERPGTIQADIYALGMVLYVISTGKDPGFFPDINTTLMERSGHQEFLRLDTIILKACQPDILLRYQTTALMLSDLQAALNKV
jgi:CHASE2 domain-containing sensor protein